MPRILDNIQERLLPALRATLQTSKRADFCVGYLNLRGWQAIDDLIQTWSPDQGQVCRVMVQRPSHEEVRELYRAETGEAGMDNASAVRLRSQFAAHLREQITLGIPTGPDEHALRRFARQLRAGQVEVPSQPATSWLSSTLHCALKLAPENVVRQDRSARPRPSRCPGHPTQSAVRKSKN